MAKGKKKTVSGGSSPAIDDDHMADQQGTKHGSVVNGGTMSSASMTKPTGLRVPSPKLGYFDGVSSQNLPNSLHEKLLLNLCECFAVNRRGAAYQEHPQELVV